MNLLSWLKVSPYPSYDGWSESHLTSYATAPPRSTQLDRVFLYHHFLNLCLCGWNGHSKWKRNLSWLAENTSPLRPYRLILLLSAWIRLEDFNKLWCLTDLRHSRLDHWFANRTRCLYLRFHRHPSCQSPTRQVRSKWMVSPCTTKCMALDLVFCCSFLGPWEQGKRISPIKLPGQLLSTWNGTLWFVSACLDGASVVLRLVLTDWMFTTTIPNAWLVWWR